MARSVVRRRRSMGAAAVTMVVTAAILGVRTDGAAAARPVVADARAAILFFPPPQDPGGRRAMLSRLADGRRAMSVGLMSPSVGRYSRTQTLLDLGQGARVAPGQYPSPPPMLRFDPAAERIVGWDAARRRADAVTGKIEPGLLAEAVRRAGRPVSFSGERRVEALVAADRAGRVAPARSARGTGGAATGSGGRSPDGGLLVASLPEGPSGFARLDRLLRARRASDIVVVVEAPPPRSEGARPLLAIAVAGPGFGPGAGLTSATTRRDGLVAAIDVAPTVLARLGVAPPAATQGFEISSQRRVAGASAVAWLRDRLGAIVEARIAALLALLVGATLVLAALARPRGWTGARAAARIGLLAALWLPSLALAAAGAAEVTRVSASPLVEGVVLAVAALALAAVSDRALGWPRGPALPAGVLATACAADLALGADLIPLSIVGSNPAAGARFFGVGNELEVILGIALLAGAGAALSGGGGRSPRAVGMGFAAVGLAGVALTAPAGLGADVGAIATLGVGTVVAVAASLARVRPAGAAAALVLVPAVALGAVAAVDLAGPVEAHLGRTLSDPLPGALLDAVERRAVTQVGLVATPAGAALTAGSLAVLGWVLVRRRRLLSTLEAARARPLAAGLAGAVAATVAGAVANDSATDMLAIGSVLCALVAAYAGSPSPTARSVALTRSGSTA